MLLDDILEFRGARIARRGTRQHFFRNEAQTFDLPIALNRLRATTTPSENVSFGLNGVMNDTPNELR